MGCIGVVLYDATGKPIGGPSVPAAIARRCLTRAAEVIDPRGDHGQARAPGAGCLR